MIEQTYHDEETLLKVYMALQNNNGMTTQQASDVVTTLQNAGILFRERIPE